MGGKMRRVSLGRAAPCVHDVDAKLSDGHQVETAEDGDDRGWGSDTSSDLFELDLDAANNH